MASIGWEKTGKRWRVFLHVTLSDGTVDKGSKSFKVKKVAQSFKTHCEKREQVLKRAEIIEPVLLDEAVNHWEDFCQGYTDRTAKQYVSEVQRFMNFLPISVVYITDLTKFHINSYLNSLMSRGLVNKTVNNTMCAIKSLCKYIHDNYGIDNPAAGIKKLKEDPAEVYFINQQEYEAVLESCSDVVHPWVVFLGNTGLRATEFCGLRWKNCDIKHKTITVVGKGRKRRTVGLNDAAIGVLEQVKDGRGVEDFGGQALETTYEYNNQGEIVKTTLPSGKWTETTRDGRGLVKMQTVGHDDMDSDDWLVTLFYYDANGNLIERVAPDGASTEYEYDNLDRMTKVKRGIRD